MEEKYVSISLLRDDETKVVQVSPRMNVKELLEHGIKIFELQPLASQYWCLTLPGGNKRLKKIAIATYAAYDTFEIKRNDAKTSIILQPSHSPRICNLNSSQELMELYRHHKPSADASPLLGITPRQVLSMSAEEVQSNFGIELDFIKESIVTP